MNFVNLSKDYGINIEGSIKALKLKILMPHDSLKPRALIFKYLCEAKSVCCYSFKNNKTINCSICVVCVVKVGP